MDFPMVPNEMTLYMLLIMSVWGGGGVGAWGLQREF